MKCLKTSLVNRAYCVKIFKYFLLTAILIVLITIYLIFAQLSQDKSFGNKVARVLDIVNKKPLQEDPEPEDLNHIGGEDNIEENLDGEEDGWVEDPDSKILDAKVMKKGNHKLVIVDIPNPKAKWMNPGHQDED